MIPNLYGQTDTGHNICDGKVHSQKHSGVHVIRAFAPPSSICIYMHIFVSLENKEDTRDFGERGEQIFC